MSGKNHKYNTLSLSVDTTCICLLLLHLLYKMLWVVTVFVLQARPYTASVILRATAVGPSSLRWVPWVRWVLPQILMPLGSSTTMLVGQALALCFPQQSEIL